MKKRTAGFALAAAAGFTALSAAPAMAVGLPFANCGEAAAVNVYNIPIGTPGYAPRLDDEPDGVGCENGNIAYDPSIVARIVAENTPIVTAPPTTPTPTETPQMRQMPVGGADTGVAQEKSSNNLGALALGGGLILAAAAGGTYVVRRRNAEDA